MTPLEIAIAALEEIADLEDDGKLDNFDRAYRSARLSKKALLDIRREQALFGGKEKVDA